jgi:hypothetical protein
MRLSTDSEILGGLIRRPPPVVSPKAQRVANEVRVLNAVANHGTLSASLLGAACWPSSKASVGLQMAQRTVRRLCAEGALKARRSGHGGLTYVLTKSGATIVGAKHGYDHACSGGTYTHHLLTSSWAIHHGAKRFRCFTEHAFTHGRAPLTAKQLVDFCGRQPDAICIGPGPLNTVWFAETELAAKSSPAVQAICGVVATRLGCRIADGLPYVFGGLFVVMSAEMEWHARHFERCARARWGQSAAVQRSTMSEHIVLSRVESGPTSWKWKGCTDSRLVI